MIRDVYNPLNRLKDKTMRPTAKLIHKTDMTYLPTAFPAHYYGMPDGKIYLVFSRFYKVQYKSGIEFVFAEHKEFTYDYQNEKIIPHFKVHHNVPIYSETVDKPDAEIEVLEVKRGLNSYAEAFLYLNSTACGIKKPETAL
jgi:hypothetical protein